MFSDAVQKDSAPLVSIITPCHNSGDFIEATFDCILAQTHQNWEWLVVDDSSKDNTPSLLREFAEIDRRVRPIFCSRNLGAGVARNEGLDRSRGEFISFIDSDDLWHPEKLEMHLRFMGDHVDLSFSAFEEFSGLCSSVNYIDQKGKLEYNYEDVLRKSATFGTSTVVMRRRALGDTRMTNWRRSQDYIFWLDITAKGHSFYRFSQPLTRYRLRDDSLSSNKFKKAVAQAKVYRQHLGFNLLQVAFYMFFYVTNALKKKVGRRFPVEL